MLDAPFDLTDPSNIIHWAKQVHNVWGTAPDDEDVAIELAYAMRVLALVHKYRDQFDPEDEYCRFHDLLAEANLGTGGKT